MSSRRPTSPRARQARRGSALILTLLLTAALGALAMSAIFLSSNAGMLSRVSDREADLRTAADAAVQIGRNMIAYSPDTLPATGYSEIALPNGTITGADGKPIDNITVKLYVGPTGSTTKDAGSFASIVADAKDERGGHAVRRLEVLRESFAKFAYFSNSETFFSTGTPILFACGDQLQGPVFSNSVINMTAGCAAGSKPLFLQDVSTAATINVPGSADLRAGYKENQKPISLPSTTQVAYLKTRAAQGGTSFIAPAGGTDSFPTLRVEFMQVDATKIASNADTIERGFVRVFRLPTPATARQLQLLRADFHLGDAFAQQTFCGDYHTIKGVKEFFPISEHKTANMNARMNSAVAPTGNYLNSTERTASLNLYKADTLGTQAAQVTAILSHPGARCFPAGAPELWLTEWWPRLNVAQQLLEGYHGGTDITYLPGLTAYQSGGTWAPISTLPVQKVIDARKLSGDSVFASFATRNGTDATYLFPLDPDYNANSKRVIDVQGHAAVSGTVRGFYTLHTTGSVLIIDDLEYATPPGAASGSAPASAANCHDILGIVAEKNVMIADNAIMVAQRTSPTADVNWGPFQTLNSGDGTPDATVDGIIMALGTSWYVEHYNEPPYNGVSCAGNPRGRGCLWLIGGLIQVNRGAVAQNGSLSGTPTYSGYTKRYTYDLCAVLTPPPFFPTTGNFKNNRYAELDPASFDVAALFASLAPKQ